MFVCFFSGLIHYKGIFRLFVLLPNLMFLVLQHFHILVLLDNVIVLDLLLREVVDLQLRCHLLQRWDVGQFESLFLEINLLQTSFYGFIRRKITGETNLVLEGLDFSGDLLQKVVQRSGLLLFLLVDLGQNILRIFRVWSLESGVLNQKA